MQRTVTASFATVCVLEAWVIVEADLCLSTNVIMCQRQKVYLTWTEE